MQKSIVLSDIPAENSDLSRSILHDLSSVSERARDHGKVRESEKRENKETLHTSLTGSDDDDNE